MNQIKQSKKFIGRIVLALLVFSLAACDSGGSTSTGSDGIQTFSRTAVEGNVSNSSFSGGDVAGITVSVGDRSTMTDAAGNFQLTEIPTGEQTVVFSKGGEKASMKVNVASGGTLTISNVRVGRNSATGSQSSSSSSSSAAPRDKDDDDSSDDRKGSSDND